MAYVNNKLSFCPPDFVGSNKWIARSSAALLVGLLSCAMLALGATPLACIPDCNGGTRDFTGGTVFRTASGEVVGYETSSSKGPFLAFDGATTLHIRHQMGKRPRSVTLELAFSENPEAVGGGGAAFAAGNQAILVKRDETEIVVKNDSCGNYFIRVVTDPVP